MRASHCLLLFAVWLWSCDSPDPVSPHSHEAPRGGTLVALGDHFANVELVWHLDTGELQAFVLGPHASQAVRIVQAQIELTLGDRAIVLHAVESALSGEKAGDTSAFAGELRLEEGETPPLAGALERIEVFGRAFEDVAFRLEPVRESNTDSRESLR